MQKSSVVNMEHFTRAIARIRPSVLEKDQLHYGKLRKMYATVPENEVEEMAYSEAVFYLFIRSKKQVLQAKNTA